MRKPRPSGGEDLNPRGAPEGQLTIQGQAVGHREPSECCQTRATLSPNSELVVDCRTAIAAIHDPNLPSHFCDEIALTDDGELLARGPPAWVLTARTRPRLCVHTVVSEHPVTGAVSVTGVPGGQQDVTPQQLELAPPRHGDWSDWIPSVLGVEDVLRIDQSVSRRP